MGGGCAKGLSDLPAGLGGLRFSFGCLPCAYMQKFVREGEREIEIHIRAIV